MLQHTCAKCSTLVAAVHLQDDGEAEVLDAEALQDLLGGGSSGRAASKYKAKAAAIARMGGAAATAKKAAATTGRGKRK